MKISLFKFDKSERVGATSCASNYELLTRLGLNTVKLTIKSLQGFDLSFKLDLILNEESFDNCSAKNGKCLIKLLTKDPVSTISKYLELDVIELLNSHAEDCKDIKLFLDQIEALSSPNNKGGINFFGSDSSQNHQITFEATEEFKSFNDIFNRLRKYLAISRACYNPNSGNNTDLYYTYESCDQIVTDIDKAISDYNQPQMMNNRYERMRAFINNLTEIINKNQELDDRLLFICKKLRLLMENFPNQLNAAHKNETKDEINFYLSLIGSKTAEYLKIKYTEEYVSKHATSPNAKFYKDNTVAAMTRTEVINRCQSLHSQLEYFAFNLLRANQRTSNLSTLNSYAHSVDAVALGQLGFICSDNNGQWAFLDDSFIQYFAARYIASCVLESESSQLLPKDKSIDCMPYKHRWVNNESIYEYIAANINDKFHQEVWKYAGSMLKLANDEESLSFFQRLADKIRLNDETRPNKSEVAMKTIKKLGAGEHIHHKGDLTIEGNVGKQAQIIIEEGSLLIKGCVENGSSIEADQEINLGSVADNVTLSSKHGYVIVQGKSGNFLQAKAKGSVSLRDVGNSPTISSLDEDVSLQNIGTDGTISAKKQIVCKGECPDPDSLTLTCPGEITRPKKLGAPQNSQPQAPAYFSQQTASSSTGFFSSTTVVESKIKAKSADDALAQLRLMLGN